MREVTLSPDSVNVSSEIGKGRLLCTSGESLCGCDQEYPVVELKQVCLNDFYLILVAR